MQRIGASARGTSASRAATATTTTMRAAIRPYQQLRHRQQHQQQQQQQQQEQRREHLRPHGAIASAAAAASLSALLALGAAAPARADALLELPFEKPVITTESSPRAVQLAARLKAAGARLYGAFWCSHCLAQEEAFGRQAMAAGFPYTECFPDGWSRGGGMAPACEALPVRAFPTWAIGGRIVEGELSFDAIEALLDEASGGGGAAAPAAN